MKRTTKALGDITTETSQLGQLEPGVTLQERYLVLARHGAGGMSSVYRARDLHFPNVTKTVAVKEMINMATDPSMHEMIVRNFEREADLLATLSHPAIPRIYDYFTHESSSYLVMEFIDGKDLEALLRESDDFLPEDQVVKWAIELCDVLNYLHNHKPQPVIFRDVKPSNIMIDSHGSIRLIEGKGLDFERYALNKLFTKLANRYSIQTVLEIPAKGEKAMPSLYSLAFGEEAYRRVPGVLVHSNVLNSFLQGQFSNDLRAVTLERSQLSSYSSAKGRMLALMRVMRRPTSNL